MSSVAVVLGIYNLRGHGELPEKPALMWRSYGSPDTLKADWPKHFEAKYQYGWPLAYTQLPCYLMDVSEIAPQYYMFPASRWLPRSTSSRGFDRLMAAAVNEFSTALSVLDVLLALLTVVSTGYWSERWLRNRDGRTSTGQSASLQFGLRSMLHLSAIVAVMFGMLHADPSLWDSALGAFIWLLSGVLGFGVVCAICTAAAIGGGLVRCVRMRREAG